MKIYCCVVTDEKAVATHHPSQVDSIGFVFVPVFVAGSVSASHAGGTILHPCKPLLARPILVEADIVRIQVSEDLPAQF